jgi:hypothetical protein
MGTMAADLTRRFRTTTLARSRGGIAIELPFDPNDAWWAQPRHDVHGTIGGFTFRGQLSAADDGWRLELGPSWCRDPRVGVGREVDVVMSPEPPHQDSIADDVRAALIADPEARRQFGSIATFYRKGFIDWIESSKRPETRAKRIVATVTALHAGRREP